MAATPLHPETAPATVKVPVADIERMAHNARFFENLLLRADVVLATILNGNMVTAIPTDQNERDANVNACSLLAFLRDDLEAREKIDGTALSIELSCLAR